MTRQQTLLSIVSSFMTIQSYGHHNATAAAAEKFSARYCCCHRLPMSYQILVYDVRKMHQNQKRSERV